MTALTELAAIRMRERELLHLKCAVKQCAHPLGSHSIFTNQCAGELGGKPCPCSGWQDPTEKKAKR